MEEKGGINSLKLKFKAVKMDNTLKLIEVKNK